MPFLIFASERFRTFNPFQRFFTSKEEKPSLKLNSSLKIPGQGSTCSTSFLISLFFSLLLPHGNSRGIPEFIFQAAQSLRRAFFHTVFSAASSGRENGDRQNGGNGRRGEKQSENLKRKNQKRRKIRILPPAVSRREQFLSLPDRGVNSFSSNAALR